MKYFCLDPTIYSRKENNHLWKRFYFRKPSCHKVSHSYPTSPQFQIWPFLAPLHSLALPILASNFFSRSLSLNLPPHADEKERVFCYQNCSDLLREKNVLVIDKNF